MAKYSAVKATVNAYIKQNGRKEITGRILNAVLNATIDSLGKYFQFAGGALPTDDPGTPDQNVCYLAGEPGVYTNFGGITIENEEVALLFWDGEWTKQRILIGIREVNASVDNQVGTPSVDVSYSGGELVLTFHNLKGEHGDTGDPAGFGTIGADINGGVGTPGVSVETSGDNTAKNLMFHFTNLKGETGVTSVVATIDDTSGTPSCQVSLVGQQLTLAFSGLKGLKGDTGVSADYPITIYNGLDSDATDQALSAAQGKVLDGKVSQLEAEVNGLDNSQDFEFAIATGSVDYTKTVDVKAGKYNITVDDANNALPQYTRIYLNGTNIGYLKFLTNPVTISADVTTIRLYASAQATNSGDITIHFADTTPSPSLRELINEANENAQDAAEDVATLETTVENNDKKVFEYTPILTDGAFIFVDNGNEVTASSYSRSDYLFLFSSVVKVTAYFADAAGVAFYDTNKNFISAYQKPSSTPSGSVVDIPVPANAMFFRVSCLVAQKANFKITIVPGTDYAFGSRALSFFLANETDLLSFMNTDTLIDLGVLVNGFVNSVTGNFLDATSYKRTGLVRINAVKVRVVVTATVSQVGIAFYDRWKRYTGGSDFVGKSYGETIEISVPEGTCYFAYCAINEQAPNMRIWNLKIGELVNHLAPESQNPCFYTATQEARTFRKILCIGDSLTEGAFDYKEDGVTKEMVIPSLSYPGQLASITGRETTNAGDSGETTKTWWELHQDDDLSGHDACIIALGRNDYVPGRETTSEERILYMTNIVNKVKADNPQIKIFISTMINYYTGASADAVNADMRTIANTLTDCYLVDISTYGKLVSGLDNYSHCTAIGYHKLAGYYFHYISYIMASNPSDFRNIQFTGTNRQYN